MHAVTKRFNMLLKILYVAKFWSGKILVNGLIQTN